MSVNHNLHVCSVKLARKWEWRSLSPPNGQTLYFSTRTHSFPVQPCLAVKHTLKVAGSCGRPQQQGCTCMTEKKEFRFGLQANEMRELEACPTKGLWNILDPCWCPSKCANVTGLKHQWVRQYMPDNCDRKLSGNLTKWKVNFSQSSPNHPHH